MGEHLKIKNLSFSYQSKAREVICLKDINLKVKNGEFVSIVGPSGCGKSTLLSIISGLYSIVHGDVTIAGKSIKNNRINVGYMQQFDNLLDWRTVESNILFGLEIQKKINTESISYAHNLIKAYGLENFKESYPHQLSGGMRQRAALIRTLATKPKLLLLDEAFSALDFQTKLTVTNDIKNILNKEHMTTLMVTHDVPESISMADRVVVLSDRPGKIKSIYNIEELKSTHSPIERRKHPEFNEYIEKILEDLQKCSQTTQTSRKKEKAIL